MRHTTKRKKKKGRKTKRKKKKRGRAMRHTPCASICTHIHIKHKQKKRGGKKKGGREKKKGEGNEAHTMRSIAARDAR